MRLIPAPLIIAIACGLLAAPSATAATFVVNTSVDVAGIVDGACNDGPGGTCSLREAVREANALVGLDTIELNTDVDLTLIGAGEDAAATGDLDLTDVGSVSIQSPGVGCPIRHSIDASALGDRAFDVLVDGSFPVFRCLTIVNATATDGAGGCFRAPLNLVTLEFVRLVRCGSTTPGAVGAIEAGGLDLTNSVVIDPFVAELPGARNPAAIRTESYVQATRSELVGANSVMIESIDDTVGIHDATIARSHAAIRSNRGIFVHDSRISGNGVTFAGSDDVWDVHPAIKLVGDGNGGFLVTGSEFRGNGSGVIDVTGSIFVPHGFAIEDSSFVGNAPFDGVDHMNGMVTLRATGGVATLRDVESHYNSAGIDFGFPTEGVDVDGLVTSHNVPTTTAICTTSSICVDGASGPVSIVDVTSRLDEGSVTVMADDLVVRNISVEGSAAIPAYGGFVGANTLAVEDVRVEGGGGGHFGIYGDTIRGVQARGIAIDLCGAVRDSTIVDAVGPVTLCGSIGRSIIAGSTCDPANMVTSAGYNAFTGNGSGCGYSAAAGDVAGASVVFDTELRDGVADLRPRAGDVIDLVPAAACIGAFADVVARPTGAGCEPGRLEARTTSRAELSLRLVSDLPAVARPGQAGTLVLTTRNNGPDRAANVVMSVTIPADIVTNTLPAGCSLVDVVVACSAGTLAVGSTATRSIAVRLGPGIGSRFVQASATSSTPDVDGAVDTASLTVDVATPVPGLDPLVDPPTLLVAPVIVGDAEIGGRLACAPGAWRNAESWSFAWLLGGEPIRGAESSLLRVTGAMRDRVVTCQVTARNTGGSTVALSDSVGPVTPRGAADGPPRCTITGTSRRDVLRGTPRRDVICGGAGNDVIHGLGGNDVLIGGPGRDVMHGGAGNDRIEGEGGNDRLLGEAGSDTLLGGDGDDQLDGGAGSDSLSGGAGRDVLSGAAGGDLLNGGAGTDRLLGGAQFDVVFGGAGNDTLDGGAGNDLLTGNDGNDVIEGQAGSDSLWGGAGSDRMDGGADADQVWGMADDDDIVADLLDHVNAGDGIDTINGVRDAA
jgi:CSLREA domain-containing protein/uncharacterized repeat protein (TIGR01451 family)